VSDTERKRFKGTIRRLTPSGDLIRPEDGTFEYQSNPDSVAERLRCFLKTCVGQDVTIKQMPHAVGRDVSPPDMRLARERMEAEGYNIRFIRQGKPPVQHYRVKGPNESANRAGLAAIRVTTGLDRIRDMPGQTKKTDKQSTV
jgi:hypothetical protein